MDYSPDGRTLALAIWNGQVKRIDTSTLQEIESTLLEFRNPCVGVKYSPNGKLLAYVGGSEFEQGGDATRTAKVMLWDVDADKLRGDLPGHQSLVTSVDFSPNSEILATGSADNTVKLWDTSNGTTVRTLKGHTDAVWAIRFISDKTLASASWDGTLRFWDLDTGEQLASFSEHDAEILCLAISPDRKTLATGSGDLSIRLWDIEKRKVIAKLAGHYGSIYSVAFSPDGKTLASGSGDETVRLWGVATGQQRSILRGHQSGVSAVTFSPDGKTVITAGRDDPVRQWEVILNSEQ